MVSEFKKPGLTLQGAQGTRVLMQSRYLGRTGEMNSGFMEPHCKGHHQGIIKCI